MPSSGVLSAALPRLIVAVRWEFLLEDLDLVFVVFVLTPCCCCHIGTAVPECCLFGTTKVFEHCGVRREQVCAVRVGGVRVELRDVQLGQCRFQLPQVEACSRHRNGKFRLHVGGQLGS